MAYIGRTPTPAALTASDITDGIISEAKMADDAISLTELKAGTDGNIISYDTSGNPVAVATGTDGQVLTSSGAGAVCAFEDAAGGGAWNLLSTATTSDQAAIEITSNLDNTYRFYAVMMSEIVPASDGDLLLGVSQDGGSTWLGASGYRGAYTSYGYGDTGTLVKHESNDAGYGYKIFNDTQNQADSASVIFYIDNPSGTSYEKLFWGSGVLWNSSGVLSSTNFAATYDGTNPTAAIDAIKLEYSSGNISAVTKLYGIS